MELTDEGTYMIVNGRRYGPYHYEWRPPLPSFSPDGSDWGFLFQDRAGWFVKMGNFFIGPYPYVQPPVLSNGGKRWGFVCRKKGRGWFTVLNFKNLGPYGEVAHFSVSPDGSAAAFGFRRGGKWFVHLDDGDRGPYEGGLQPEPSGHGLGLLRC